MSRATNSPIRVSPGSFGASSALSTAVSLAPLPASEAVGRATGVGRAPLTAASRKAALRIGALVALIAAATLPPMMAAAFALPL